MEKPACELSRLGCELSRLPGQISGTKGRGHGGTKALRAFVPLPVSRDNVPFECPGVPVGGVGGGVVGGVEASKPGRQAMPLTAAIVDDLRLQFGAAVVDRCIARGQRLRREHARLLASAGQAQADQWLAWEQRRGGGWFGAVEGGRAVGVLGVQPCS